MGLLVGLRSEALCLPLEARLPQGFAHLDPDESSTPNRDTQGVRLVQLAMECVTGHDIPSILVFETFFSSRAVFELAGSVWSMALKPPLSPS